MHGDYSGFTLLLTNVTSPTVGVTPKQSHGIGELKREHWGPRKYEGDLTLLTLLQIGETQKT